MDLHLTDEEIEELRRLLDSTLRDLSFELADTDSSIYRAQLREQRDRLKRILDAVGGPLPDEEAAH